MLKSDQDMFQFAREHLHVAVVCDILDTLGFRHQAMHPRLRPLLPDIYNCGFIGRARTFHWMPTDYVFEEDPYGQEIDLMDDLKPGDVLVHSTLDSDKCTPFGELMSTIAMRNGAVGCICDSGVRDCVKILEMGFPVYYAGINPVDSNGRGRVMAIDVPVSCGDLIVKPGEIIFAGYDGIVVIPQEAETKVFDLAYQKVNTENAYRTELVAGASLREVYDKYKIL